MRQAKLLQQQEYRNILNHQRSSHLANQAALQIKLNGKATPLSGVTSNFVQQGVGQPQPAHGVPYMQYRKQDMRRNYGGL